MAAKVAHKKSPELNRAFLESEGTGIRTPD